MIGRQYIWQYVYPGASEPDGLGAPYSYEEMVVPTDTTVSLDMRLRRRRALVVDPRSSAASSRPCPGYHNYTWFKIPKAGVYRGQCAFLCGRGHARMIATVTRGLAGAVRSVAGEPEAARSPKPTRRAKEERAKLTKQTGAGQVENP